MANTPRDEPPCMRPRRASLPIPIPLPLPGRRLGVKQQTKDQFPDGSRRSKFDRVPNQLLSHLPYIYRPACDPLILPMIMSRDEEEGVVDLWAMAAELERHFAGYKHRLALAGNNAVVPDVDVGACASINGGDTEEEDGGDVRPGRMYEAYTRRRDERLRSGWRARMERKEAQVMALLAQLDSRGGGPSTTPAAADDGGTALLGEEAEEDDEGEKRRSSDVAAPGRVSGKKHARTTRRSFSSTSLKSVVDVGIRRALSQEAPGADGGTSSKKHSHRSRAVTGGAATRGKASSSSSSSGSKKGSAKEHGGSLRPAGLKPPRGFVPRRCSSGGLEGVARDREEAVLMPMPMPSQSCSSQQVDLGHDGDYQKASSSSPEPVARIGNGTENASLPEEDCHEGTSSSAVEDSGEAEAEPGIVEVDVEKRDAAVEEITAQRSPEAKLGNNGEMITSDSETEPSYVFIKKKAAVVEEEEAIAMRHSEALAVSESDAIPVPHLKVHGDNGMASAAPTATADMAAESTATRETSADTAPTSRSSRDRRTRSIERLLEADAALLRRKRQESSGNAAASAGKSFDPPTTPGSAGSRQASGASPRGASMGFKKRFLNFGKKNTRGNRETAAVGIDCTSPSTPVTPVDDGAGGGRWQAAASEETDHGAYAASPPACSLQSLVAASPAKSELGDIVPQEKSPRAHRSFFSLRSFNCSRS
ncbi:hypothetical protein BRADI_3g60070v3 [Brachypodium distachyon]|uniref:Uncharacterized protein n=1 Tax=Brachypodium distachyon TaxID=15368 RepID=A0A2K2D5Z8_BRADI|nr:hypothetical protein BRADI_3g60070v3 [Brachypodium distachyon]